MSRHRTASALMVALALGLAGCGDGGETETTTVPPTTASPTSAALPDAAAEWLSDDLRAALEADARAMVESLEAGDAGPIMDRASATVAEAATAEGLRDAWAATAAAGGAFVEIGGVRTEPTEQWAVVSVYPVHEDATYRVDLTFTAAGEVDGVWFNVADPAELEELGIANEAEDTPPGGEGEDVTIGEHALPGTLLVPEGADTVVLFVSGSGPQDRNGTIGGSAMYQDVAEGLAAAGIASLRVDDRFFAHPELSAADTTVRDESLDDAAAAIAFLSADPRTAGMAIVVIGHSLGAMILPNVIAENPDVDGGVMAAGSPRSLWDIILSQNIAVFDSADPADLEGQPTLAEITAEVERANGLTDPAAPPILGSLPAPYVVSLNELHSSDVAAGLTVPLLVIQGDADVQVSVTEDYEAWTPVLANVPDVTYELFPGVNHLFMPSAGGGVEEYVLPNTVAPEVLDAVVTWIDARF